MLRVVEVLELLDEQVAEGFSFMGEFVGLEARIQASGYIERGAGSVRFGSTA